MNSLCPACSASNVKILFERRGDPFAECFSCGLIFQCTPPSAEESRVYYQEAYYDALAPIMPDLLQARASIYRGLLDEAQAWRKTGRILDVGCGHGDFLRLAAAEGWEAHGIEPSKEAADAAASIPGLKIFYGTAEAAGFEENSFDVITLWNVLDCLPDSHSTLQKIRGWLRPGGLLVIRTPNAGFHFFMFRLQQKLRPLLEKIGWKKDASVFLRSNFRARTLRRLLEGNGFEKVQVRNGEMTQGDPYQVVSVAGLVQFLKKTIYSISSALEWITQGRLLSGSVMLAKATKDASVPSPLDLRPDPMRLGLKKLILHGLAVLGYLLGLPLWRKLSGGDREIRILTYHSIHPCGNDLAVRPRDFEKQMEFLARHYDVLPLEQAVNLLERGQLPLRPSAAVTLDDGFEDNHQFLLPVLSRQKIPVTIFQVTGQKRKASYLAGSPLLLSDEKIREMAAQGVGFGSHGESHSRLSELPETAVLEEMTASKQNIEKVTGRPVEFFAYPYGRLDDFNAQTRELARAAQYRAAFSAVYGMNHAGTDRFALKRIGVEAADTLFTVRAKLNGALDLLTLRNWAPVRAILGKEALQDAALLVSVDFPPYQNGVSTISGHLSRELSAEMKQNFCVIAPQAPGDLAYDQKEAYRVWRYPGNELGWWRFGSVFLFMPWVVLKHRIRKVLAMNIAYGGVTAWLLSLIYPLRYIVFAYGYEFEKFKNISWIRAVYRKIYGRAGAVIVCSAAVGDRLALFGVDPAKIEVIYPAVDTSRFFPLPEEKKKAFLEQNGLEGRRIILSAGRLVERKGHDQVLRALLHVREDFPDVLYLIAGEGPSSESLHALVNELGLQNSVRFLGRVSDEDLNGFYNACEFFIMPSREIPEEGHVEGFGIVYLEANACGKPVIGGRTGGVVEAILEGKTGLLADPHSPQDIAEKMLEFLSRPAEAKKMGAEGLDRLRREFSWSQYAEKTKRFL